MGATVNHLANTSEYIFAEKTDMILLKPGQSYECRYTVKFYDEQ